MSCTHVQGSITCSASKCSSAPEGHLKEVPIGVGHSWKSSIAQQYVGFNAQILETNFQGGQVNSGPVHDTSTMYAICQWLNRSHLICAASMSTTQTHAFAGQLDLAMQLTLATHGTGTDTGDAVLSFLTCLGAHELLSRTSPVPCLRFAELLVQSFVSCPGRS